MDCLKPHDAVRFEHAIQDASAALFFKPEYAKAFATRAAAHVELEHLTDAEQDYESATKLEPAEREHERQLQQVRIEIVRMASQKQ